MREQADFSAQGTTAEAQERSGFDVSRVNAVLSHPLFRDSLGRTGMFEVNRVFCKHGLEHLIDVARISYILSLESGAAASRELLYTAALLHDIGRWRQYEDGTPHEEASADLASRILADCGFNSAESELILEAILSHRTDDGEKPGFSGMIYRADKLSRLCMDCLAEDECDWKIKNIRLEY